MWPEDCLMCRCDGVRDRCWKEALCSAARSTYTATSCFRPLSSQAAQCTHLASEKKKVKTEGFSTPGSAAQDPIHLPLLLQDDFIFQIHKYFPVKAPEIQERAYAWLSSVSPIWGLWGTVWLLGVRVIKILSCGWCAVSVTARGLKGATKVHQDVWDKLPFPKMERTLQSSHSRPGGLLGWVVEGSRVLRCYSWNYRAPSGPDHSLRDNTVIVGHTVFVQRPLSRWNREAGVFKIPGEMAKWVNNWEHKQTQGH